MSLTTLIILKQDDIAFDVQVFLPRKKMDAAFLFKCGPVDKLKNNTPPPF